MFKDKKNVPFSEYIVKDTDIGRIDLIAEERYGSNTDIEYILKFKDLAVIEMHRSGVPASITLAQGVLESNSGNSRLAKYANNHFGIKCKGNWTGNVIYADDDAPDECFRAYESVLNCFPIPLPGIIAGSGPKAFKLSA